MSQWARLGSAAEMPPEGEVREMMCEGRTLCVSRFHGALHAMDGVCPHRGGPLGLGTIEHGKIVCPWHGWEFDPATGVGVHNSRQTMFAVKAEADEVVVELPDPAPIP